MGNSVSAYGFTWYSTASETARDVDLHGKNVIVTGGNTGIYIHSCTYKF